MKKNFLRDRKKVSKVVKEFHAEGFIKVSSFFTPEKVISIKKKLKQYEKEIVPTLEESFLVYEPDGKSIRNLWYLQKHDSFFEKLGMDAYLLEFVEILLGHPPVLLQVETFNKSAFIGTEAPIHRDNSYLWQTPPDVLTIWIALDEANQKNGTVYYFPGTHKVSVKAKQTKIPGNSMGIQNAKKYLKNIKSAVWANCDPGDAYIHHCNTLHGSFPNNSSKNRCALLLVYKSIHSSTDYKLLNEYNAVRRLDNKEIVQV